MVRDRLEEFQTKGSAPTTADSNVPNYGATENVEMGSFHTHPDVNYEKLFYRVTVVREKIQGLQKDVDEMKQIHSKILRSPHSDAELQSNLNQLISSVKSNSKQLRNTLKEMNSQTTSDPVSALERTRITQYSALLLTFNNVMDQYNAAQTDFRNGCKARIKRQLEVAQIPHDEHQLEEMIRDGNIPNFAPNLLVNETEDAKKMLADVEARRNNIFQLEQAIVELHELFSDIAFLVETQGEVVSNIANNVSKTQDWVGKAKVTLLEAKDIQTKTRKRMIIISSVLAMVVVVLILILYFSLRRK